MRTIEQSLQNILMQSLVTDSASCTATIGVQVEKELFSKAKQFFEHLGGKWNRSAASFKFGFDPDPLIQAVLDLGVMPEKNPTAYYPTPRQAILEMMLYVDESRIRVGSETRILEPSAGTGAIAEYIRSIMADGATLDTVEFLEANQRVLQNKGFNPFCGDFLSFDAEEKYDIIVMNPPFSVKGDSTAYITHINHALTLLKPDGNLVAITPKGWRSNSSAKEVEFRDLVAHYSCDEVGELASGTFKESGTNVATDIISLSLDDWRLSPINGYKNYYAFCFGMELNNSSCYTAEVENIKGSSTFKENQANYLAKTIINNAQKERFTNLPLSRLSEYVEVLRDAWQCRQDEMPKGQVELAL